MTAVFQAFACPVCGHVREISARALRTIENGHRSGECRSGEGCRAPLDAQERLRRWWLHQAGVSPAEIRRVGGAVAYVLEHGFPDRLWRVGCAASDIPQIYFERALVQQKLAA